MHIHSGAAGVAGPVTINSGLTAASNRVFKATGDMLKLQAQFGANDTAALATINGMLQDPSQYYFNIHTTTYPNGVIRGHLVKGMGVFLIGSMTSGEEVPNPNVPASGTAVVFAIAAVDARLNIGSGAAYMQTSYNIPETGNLHRIPHSPRAPRPDRTCRPQFGDSLRDLDRRLGPRKPRSVLLRARPHQRRAGANVRQPVSESGR